MNTVTKRKHIAKIILKATIISVVTRGLQKNHFKDYGKHSLLTWYRFA